MKKILIAIPLSLFLGACTKQSGTSGQGSSAQSDFGSSIKQQKDNVEDAAREAQRQVKEAASAQKKRIEAEAKAAKAKIEAEKAEAEAAAKTENRNIDEQTKRMQQAVGSAQQSVTGKQRDDTQLLNQVRQKTAGDNNVQVSVENGVVTLNGSVKTEQEKTSLEQQIKQLNGVQDVKNKLTVDQNQ